MFPAILRCTWLTTALILFVACISLCSIFSELWSLGFYICYLSGGFNLLESDFGFAKPLFKNVAVETSLVCNRNSSTQEKLMQKTENMERKMLLNHELNNNKESETVENKFLELEASFIELTKVLEFEKEKCAKDQITFMRSLSDLHSFHKNKQNNLEAIIIDLQRELHVEKLRTLEQTHLIEALTLANGDATNLADILQRKLSHIGTEAKKSKMSFEKDLLQPQGKGLEDEGLQMLSLPNLKLQEDYDRLKTDLLLTKSQLEQALCDNQLLRYKFEAPETSNC